MRCLSAEIIIESEKTNAEERYKFKRIQLRKGKEQNLRKREANLKIKGSKKKLRTFLHAGKTNGKTILSH